MPVIIILAVIWLLKSLLTFPAAVERQLATLDQSFATFSVRPWLLLVKIVCDLDVLIVDAARTPAEQNALHRQNSKNPAYDPKKPSDHITGQAVDVNFLRDGKSVLLKATSAKEWATVYALASLCGMDNGSKFPGYPDNNHFMKKRA